MKVGESKTIKATITPPEAKQALIVKPGDDAGQYTNVTAEGTTLTFEGVAEGGPEDWIITTADGAQSVTLSLEALDIGLDTDSLNHMNPGQKQSIGSSLHPDRIDAGATLNWWSGDEAVATVEPDPDDKRKAIITAVAAGDTRIYCSCDFGGYTWESGEDRSSSYLEVETAAESAVISAEGVTDGAVTLEVGAELAFSLAVLPEDAEEYSVRWELVSDGDQPPTITKQPQSQNIKAPTHFTIGVTAVGDDGHGLDYQWYEITDDKPEGNRLNSHDGEASWTTQSDTVPGVRQFFVDVVDKVTGLFTRSDVAIITIT